MQQKYTLQSVINPLTNKYLFASIKGMRYTKKQFEAEYPDDDACLESVFQNRFGDLKFCPKCAAETTFYKVKKRQCYACQWCGYQLHPLADTIFRKTTTPLVDWFYAIYLFSVAKNGVSAKELERHLGVTYKTAWRMCKQIRLLMEQDNDKLSGTIEADETYVGGYNRSTRGTNFSNKTPVVGLVEKGEYGRIRTVVVEKMRVEDMLPIMHANVELGTTVQTDESRLYGRIKHDYTRQAINHTKKIYAKDGVTTNTIEGFWGQMKRSISGTYHAVSPKYLPSYVNEFVFRYNFRGVAVCPVLLELAAKPV